MEKIKTLSPTLTRQAKAADLANILLSSKKEKISTACPLVLGCPSGDGLVD